MVKDGKYRSNLYEMTAIVIEIEIDPCFALLNMAWHRAACHCVEAVFRHHSTIRLARLSGFQSPADAKQAIIRFITVSSWKLSTAFMHDTHIDLVPELDPENLKPNGHTRSSG